LQTLDRIEEPVLTGCSEHVLKQLNAHFENQFKDKTARCYTRTNSREGIVEIYPYIQTAALFGLLNLERQKVDNLSVGKSQIVVTVVEFFDYNC
jgi:hypothetical protein